MLLELCHLMSANVAGELTYLLIVTRFEQNLALKLIKLFKEEENTVECTS